jgi:hypothetical protein
LPTMPSNNMNPFATTDARTRYAATNNNFCTGDYAPGGGAPTAATRVDTSFALRYPTDSGNPLNGAPVPGCTAQYKGVTTVPTVAQLQSSNAAGYLPDLARVFHQWVELCSFTPTAAGDYYLQVRTNVALPSMSSKALIAPGNPAVTSQTGDDTGVGGLGANQFAMRATSSDNTAVSVAGYERIAIDINASNPTTTFNLIRVLPGAAGKYVRYTFYDAADGSTGGTVQVLAPTDATGSITSSSTISGCTATGVVSGTLIGCSAPVSPSRNNGKLQTVNVPIPADYSCSYSVPGGCWFRVVVKYSQATDVTTWSATVEGDPVRLVK